MKSKLTNVFTMLVVLLTAFQGLIPTLPITNNHTITLVSAIAMFLVSGFTAWKQYLSEEIANASLRPTLIVAIIATIGGLNDVFNVVQFSETADQWIRFAITFITMGLSLVSKILWPTLQTKTSL